MADNTLDIKNMSPSQVAAALKGVAPEPIYEDRFWIDKAAAIIKHTAWIALALENDDGVRARFIESEGCSPYSLLGVRTLALDDHLGMKGLECVLALADMHDDDADPVKAKLYREAVKSGTWLTEQYRGIAELNKLRFKTAVETLFPALEDDRELVERFCTSTKTIPASEPALLS
ncbi:hypothetical protein HFO61_30575 [Rhizobium leguminosarum]|uniref:hypothetical protein n=1 Tax=Rhizobium leguminosarum TaxID=384 RepID=UPI001C95CD8F|nr:hypothetical protein [Rhizobium leguminosarum]MBY5551092.1 hypothetical protein [Rhizobium leguminosarum]